MAEHMQTFWYEVAHQRRKTSVQSVRRAGWRWVHSVREPASVFSVVPECLFCQRWGLQGGCTRALGGPRFCTVFGGQYKEII
eukprot:644957-Rhodomonas_salina.1